MVTKQYYKKKQNKIKEYTRNFFLVALAVGIVVVFFNLDIVPKGESVFSQSATKKLKFSGDLKRKAYTPEEVSRLLRFIKNNTDYIKETRVDASLQDSYKKINDSSQVLFEVHLLMDDGTTITTTAHRTTRKDLVTAILAKVSKDTRIYKKLKEQGKEMRSLINTQ